MILAFGDLSSPLIVPRVKLLCELSEVVAVANANDKAIPRVPFSVRESPRAKNLFSRYIFSTLYSFWLILTLRPKVIAIHWASRRFQVLAFLPFRRRVIVSCMGGDIDSAQDFRGRKAFWTKLLLKNVACITVKSQFMKKMILKNIPEIEESIIKVVSFGVEERFFEAIPDSEVMRFLDGACGFLSIRALQEFYQIDEILEAFLSFKESCDSTAKLIVSTYGADTKYALKVQNIAKESHFRDDILFLDISQERLPSVLAAVYAVVSFAKADGLPQSIMEACAARRVVIASRLLNYDEILNEKNSILCENLNELKSAFRMALERAFHFENPSELLDKKRQSDCYLELCRTISRGERV